MRLAVDAASFPKGMGSSGTPPQNSFNVTLFSSKNQPNAFTMYDKLRHVSA